jgi:hypothetical protein
MKGSLIYDVIYQQNVQEKMSDEENRNEKSKGANARSVKTFCLHLLIIWSFDFYKEQWGYSSGSTAPKVTPE